MIRFIIIVIFLILYLILTIPVLLIEWLIGKIQSPRAGHQLSSHRPVGLQSHSGTGRSERDRDRGRKYTR